MRGRVKTSLRLAVFACFAALALTLGCTSKEAATSERFVYVIDCEARVDKLDTVAAKRVASIALSEKSALVPKVASATAGLDGCIAESVLHDAAGQVNVLVPTTTRLDQNGKRNFQVLTFALPEWSFVSAKAVGSGTEQVQFLDRDQAGQFRVTTFADRVAATDIDLRDYQKIGDAAKTSVLANSIIESSGGVALVNLFTADKSRQVLALADQRARTLNQVFDVASSAAMMVHLAPGGAFVLIEMMDAASTPPRRTGALRLIDANGKIVNEMADAEIRDHDFVTLTPNGYAVYVNNRGYLFVPIAPKNTRFGNAMVTQPSPEAKRGLVFAAQ